MHVGPWFCHAVGDVACVLLISLPFHLLLGVPEVVEDQLVESLMQRAKEQANQAMQAAGLEKFLEACESTTRKGQELAECCVTGLV